MGAVVDHIKLQAELFKIKDLEKLAGFRKKGLALKERELDLTKREINLQKVKNAAQMKKRDLAAKEIAKRKKFFGELEDCRQSISKLYNSLHEHAKTLESQQLLPKDVSLRRNSVYKPSMPPFTYDKDELTKTVKIGFLVEDFEKLLDDYKNLHSVTLADGLLNTLREVVTQITQMQNKIDEGKL